MENDTEQPDLATVLQPVTLRPMMIVARVCSNCAFSHREGNDLVCRFNPPQVTFLIVPGPVTMVPGPDGRPRPQQAMQAMPHTSFPIIRPELWCGKFEQKS